MYQPYVLFYCVVFLLWIDKKILLVAQIIRICSENKSYE